MAIALALVASVCFGLSDFLGGLAARLATAPARVAAVMYTMQVMLYLACAPLIPGHMNAQSWWWGGLAGIGFGLGLLFLYRALSAGPMSVASPIVALTAAVVPVIAAVLLGERPSYLVSGGIAAGIVAVLLLTRGPAADASARLNWNLRSALPACWSGSSFGAGFVCLSRVTPGTGVWPLALTVAVAAAILWAVAALSVRTIGNSAVRQPSDTVVTRFLPARALLLAGACALLCAVGNFAMVQAFQGSLLSIVSVIVGLSPAAVVLLALIVLRERIGWVPRAGLALGALAVGVIASGVHAG